jgi:hypothetical protein
MLSALLSWRGVLVFWIIYGLAHASLRLGVSRTLSIDDARANELTQTFAFGYQIRQPPLYEWLLWSVQQALGPGIESHLLVRYSLIACLGLATFGAVRAALKDDRWAAVASYSLVLTYPVGWTFHEWATQTLLLCIACMLTIHAAIRFIEGPGIRQAVLFGLAIAVGMYAKFSFPLFLGGLLLAALSLHETRKRLADPRLLISLCIAAIALSPYLIWVLQVRGDVVADLSSHLVQSRQSHLARAAYGLWRLAVSVPTFLLPWVALVGLGAPSAFMPPPAGAPDPWMAERLTFRTMLFALALAAVGIAAWGATNVAARYMHPILIIAPVYVFARIARLAPGEERIRQYATFAVAVAIVIFAVRFAAVVDNPLTRRIERGLLLPFAGLADALKARGIEDGTVVAVDVRVAGNLRAGLPNLRVVAGDSLRVERVPRRASDERSCVLVWIQQHDALARRMAPFDPAAVETIEVRKEPGGLLATRAATWSMVRVDPNSQACR